MLMLSPSSQHTEAFHMHTFVSEPAVLAHCNVTHVLSLAVAAGRCSLLTSIYTDSVKQRANWQLLCMKNVYFWSESNSKNRT